MEMVLLFWLGFTLGWCVVKLFEKVTENDDRLVRAGTIHILRDEDGDYPFMESSYSIEELVNFGKVIFKIEKKD